MTLFGPPVETFIPPVSREAFQSAVRQHMQWFPSRVGDGASLPGRAYAILAMCRGWYTLCVGGGGAAGDSGASEVQRFVAELARRGLKP